MSRTPVPRRVIHGMLRVMRTFRFQYDGLPVYTKRMVNVYNDRKAPSSWLGEGDLLVTQVDDRTLRIYVSFPWEIRLGDAAWQQWNEHRTTGYEIARFDLRRGRFVMAATSPLVKVAEQYGVTPPKRLDRISAKQMAVFFIKLQQAVYAACGDDFFFGERRYLSSYRAGSLWSRYDIEYDRFLIAALRAQAVGGMLTPAKYRALCPNFFAAGKLRSQGKTAPSGFVSPDEQARVNLFVHVAALLNDPHFESLAHTPLSMLYSLYGMPLSDADRLLAGV